MFLIQVEEKVDVGCMNQLLTWRVMQHGQWVLHSEVFSGSRDLCLSHCLVSHCWDREGCRCQLTAQAELVLGSEKPVQPKQLQESNPKPFKSSLDRSAWSRQEGGFCSSVQLLASGSQGSKKQHQFLRFCFNSAGDFVAAVVMFSSENLWDGLRLS